MIAERRMVFACVAAMLAILLLAIAFPVHATEPLTRAWRTLPADKRVHVAIEFEIGTLASTFDNAVMMDPQARGIDPHYTIRLWVPLAACMAVGVGKEALDESGYRTGWPERHPGQGADVLDLAADAGGCAAGMIAGTGLGTGLGWMITPGAIGVGGRF